MCLTLIDYALCLTVCGFIGVKEKDLVVIRSRPAKAMMTAVSKSINEGLDLNQLNKNGASFVS